ncbi:MAG: hypothetical protein Q9226_009362, partial [Calogaya cf. arnoldii]
KKENLEKKIGTTTEGEKEAEKSEGQAAEEAEKVPDECDIDRWTSPPSHAQSDLPPKVPAVTDAGLSAEQAEDRAQEEMSEAVKAELMAMAGGDSTASSASSSGTSTPVKKWRICPIPLSWVGTFLSRPIPSPTSARSNAESSMHEL